MRMMITIHFDPQHFEAMSSLLPKEQEHVRALMSNARDCDGENTHVCFPHRFDQAIKSTIMPYYESRGNLYLPWLQHRHDVQLCPGDLVPLNTGYGNTARHLLLSIDLRPMKV